MKTGLGDSKCQGFEDIGARSVEVLKVACAEEDVAASKARLELLAAVCFQAGGIVYSHSRPWRTLCHHSHLLE